MADSILDTITTMTGLGADPAAEAVTEAQRQLVLEVNLVSGGYRTPGLFGKGKYQQVLYDVDFNIRHGEIMGLVGESGTGKSSSVKAILNEYYKLVVEFERLGDYATNICESAYDLHRKDINLSRMASAELDVLEELLARILDLAELAFKKRDINAAEEIEPFEEVVDDMVDIMRKNHLNRLSKGLCSVTAGTDFMDILHDLERISDTCSNIGLATIARVHPETAELAHDYIFYLHAGRDEYFNQKYKEACDEFMPRLRGVIDSSENKADTDTVSK
jgi:phosphate uptake regulator